MILYLLWNTRAVKISLWNKQDIIVFQMELRFQNIWNFLHNLNSRMTYNSSLVGTYAWFGQYKCEFVCFFSVFWFFHFMWAHIAFIYFFLHKSREAKNQTLWWLASPKLWQYFSLLLIKYGKIYSILKKRRNKK